MKVSLNEIKRLGYEDIVSIPVDGLVEKIGAQLGAVEDVEDLGAKYQGVIVARVMSCESHPNADRLHICKIDDGGRIQDITRDEQGYVQVVCGAPNVREGLLVAWLPPASTVPETYHHEEPFVLGARELRGIVSNGMLASPKELALGDSHEGILEIDIDARPGQDFAEVYQLDDHIIDIENKMFTHRPDCFGLLGVARELAGIQHQVFISPQWYRDEPQFTDGEGLHLKLGNDAKDAVPRIMAVAMKDVTVRPSPVWLQTALLRMGSRPINNIVDITNYLMLMTGQPLHAYDYDKVESGHLGVRLAHDGETLTLLNGKQATLTSDDVVITNGDKAIGLGGVMGGSETEVTDVTKNIIIEVASFDMYTVRRTSMRHGLFTDAVTRFNKGQSPLQNDRVLAKAIEFFMELCGASVASSVQESRRVEDTLSVVTTTAEFVNSRLGLDLRAEDMALLLSNVEFKVTVTGDTLHVEAPFWRTDIDISEDIVEEVGRLHGFDNLRVVLPRRSLTPVDKNPIITLKQAVRNSLSRSGANELLTYSFVHEKLLAKARQNKSEAFQLSNALSPDLQFYRLSLLPSLLDKVHPNIRSGYDEIALFEIGKTHNAVRHLDDDEGLPKESGLIDLVYAATAKTTQSGAAYFRARRLLDQLASDLGLDLEYAPHEGDEQEFPIVKPFDMSRSAYVTVKGTDQFLGMIGEFHPDVAAAFKLPKYSAGFTLGVEELLAAVPSVRNSYTPLSKYPFVTQDISLKTRSGILQSELFTIAEEAIKAEIAKGHFTAKLKTISIYQPEDDTSIKTTTLRLIISNYDKTLTDQEVAAILDSVTDSAAQKIDAIRV